MRDIKFRVWSWDDKKWLNLDELSKGLVFGQMPATSPVLFSFPFATTAQQYTGLLDKNGKEIYEGDILHWSIENEDPEVVEINQGSFAVKWMPWGWVLDYPNGVPLPSTNSGLWRLIDDAEECRNNFEVIGNVYETPELLKRIGGE